MTFKRQISIVFAVALLVFATAATAGAAELDELAQLPVLEKIHGDGPDEHQPGLAESGQLRVYWFWSSGSHCSRSAEPGLEALAGDYPDIEVVVVHSNVDESISEAQKQLRERNFDVAVYRDEQARLAIALDARMTPEVVVVDDSKIIYQGRPLRISRSGTESYVAQVVQTWIDGDDIERAYRRPTGCPIRRP